MEPRDALNELRRLYDAIQAVQTHGYASGDPLRDVSGLTLALEQSLSDLGYAITLLNEYLDSL